MNDLVVVWPIVGGDFAGNKELTLFQQTLDCHTGVPVMLKDVGHNSICDLVTDLIGMTIADLFTGNNLTHVLSSLSCITKHPKSEKKSQKTVLWLICVLYRQVFRTIFYFLKLAVHDQRSLSATAFGSLSDHFKMHADSIFKVLLIL